VRREAANVLPIVVGIRRQCGAGLVVSEWSCREAAGGIPESVREPSPVDPAGRVGTPADPNIPRGREGVELLVGSSCAAGFRPVMAHPGILNRRPLGGQPKHHVGSTSDLPYSTSPNYHWSVAADEGASVQRSAIEKGCES
jgi:hypothetical protein